MRQLVRNQTKIPALVSIGQNASEYTEVADWNINGATFFLDEPLKKGQLIETEIYFYNTKENVISEVLYSREIDFNALQNIAAKKVLFAEVSDIESKIETDPELLALVRSGEKTSDILAMIESMVENFDLVQAVNSEMEKLHDKARGKLYLCGLAPVKEMNQGWVDLVEVMNNTLDQIGDEAKVVAKMAKDPVVTQVLGREEFSQLTEEQINKRFQTISMGFSLLPASVVA